MSKKIKSIYRPILIVLLVVAFYAGRLLVQLTASKGGATAETVAETVCSAPTGSKISVPELKIMAKDLGLDTNKFNTCLDSGTMADTVQAQITEGSGFGVSDTPSFYINGVMIVGAKLQAGFEAVIDAELKNGTGDKVKLPPKGVVAKRVKGIPYGVGYIKGNKDAKIKMMEYTDFECPFSDEAFPTIEALLTKYGNSISLEYRSYPLSIHSDAQKAAEAALCAGQQGKFWEMHDKMFTVMAGQ